MPEQTKQKTVLYDRKHMDISGVKCVIGFEAEYVRLDTILGDMLIKGSDLSISSLVIEKGEVEVNGHIDSISYFESGSVQKGTKKALKRLFK